MVRYFRVWQAYTHTLCMNNFRFVCRACTYWLGWLLMEEKTSANIYFICFYIKRLYKPYSNIASYFRHKLSAVKKQLHNFLFFSLGRRQFEYALSMIKKEPLISRVRKELRKLPSSKRCQTYNSWLQYFESNIQSLQFS